MGEERRPTDWWARWSSSVWANREREYDDWSRLSLSDGEAPPMSGEEEERRGSKEERERQWGE